MSRPPLKVLDLFSGIGGFSYGLERLCGGFETVAFCEIEKFPRQVLHKHWPHVPCYQDVREVNVERLRADGIWPIDVVCGGFPCTDISVAGRREGIDAPRSGLWSELARIIGEVQPRYAVVENVPNLLAGDTGRWFGRVLGDLAKVGYDAEWHCIPASRLGAPHRRDRVWIVAHPVVKGGRGLVKAEDIGITGPWGMRGEKDLCAVYDSPFTRGTGWPQPLLRGVDDGLQGRMDRLRGIGNAVVPQVVAVIGRAILVAEAEL